MKSKATCRALHHSKFQRIRRRRRRPTNHRSERSEQSDRAPVRERVKAVARASEGALRSAGAMSETHTVNTSHRRI